jgi:hypothetical protein
VSDNTLIYKDDYQIFDILANKQQKFKTGPLGFVKIFLKHKDGTLIYDEGFNLVIGQGREFIAQKISNCVLTGDESGLRSSDWTNCAVTHFGIGSNGSIINTDDSIDLRSPNITDVSLYNAISLGVNTYLTELGGSNDALGGTANPTSYAIKPVTQDGGSVVLYPQKYYTVPNQTSIYSTNYTQIKYTCKLSGGISGEPQSLLPGKAQKIDEAGLYFVNSLGSGTVAKLFAHICFAPKWKEKESDFKIEWYILC